MIVSFIRQSFHFFAWGNGRNLSALWRIILLSNAFKIWRRIRFLFYNDLTVLIFNFQIKFEGISFILLMASAQLLLQFTTFIVIKIWCDPLAHFGSLSLTLRITFIRIINLIRLLLLLYSHLNSSLLSEAAQYSI